MPELPEVETLARDLRAAVLGRTITLHRHAERSEASRAPRGRSPLPQTGFGLAEGPDSSLCSE